MKSEQFIASAQELGQDAFHDKARGRFDAAALHLGVMLEHLAKAYLVGLHPAYIVDAKTFDNLLAACGHATHVRQGHRVRTISFEEALRRFGQFNPPFQITADLRQVIDGRDGYAHAADRPEDVDRLFIATLRAAQVMLKALAYDETKFWSDYAETVTVMLTQHSDAVRAEVQLRIAEARRAYAGRFAGLDAVQVDVLVKATEIALDTADGDSTSREACPACSNYGMLSGHGDMRWEHDVDGDRDETWAVMIGTLILYPTKFRCPFCQLLLEEEDELAVVGLADERELREATDDELRDYFSDYDN